MYLQRLQDFLKVLDISQNLYQPCKALKALPQSLTNIQKLKKHCGASKTLHLKKKYLGPLSTPGVFEKYLEAFQTFWSLHNFRKNVQDLQESLKMLQLQKKKYLGPSGVFEKYLEAWKTLQSFYNFKEKYLGPPGAPGIFEKYLEACQALWSFQNFRKNNQELLKVFEKYLETCQALWSFYKSLGVSEGLWKSLEVSWSLWDSLGVCGYLLVLEYLVVSGSLWEFLGVFLSLLEFLGVSLSYWEFQASITSEKYPGPPVTPGFF